MCYQTHSVLLDLWLFSSDSLYFLIFRSLFACMSCVCGCVCVCDFDILYSLGLYLGNANFLSSIAFPEQAKIIITISSCHSVKFVFQFLICCCDYYFFSFFFVQFFLC